MPLTLKIDQVHGRTAYWLRCRVEQRREEQGMYTQSPRVVGVTAYALGATTRATHAVAVKEEVLGQTNGTPGQVFHVQHAPVLDLHPYETIEIEELRDGDLVFVPWTRVNDFSESDHFDRHFVLEASTGEVSFGPCIRQGDGAMRQYGRVPEANRMVRFTQYRHGGGIIGNMPAGRIEVLKSAIPYIDRVTNMVRAEGGRDAETLEEAQLRARREIRAQQRAVTAEDYESLAKLASRTVARVKCRAPGKDTLLPPGTLELLIVPTAFDGLKLGDLTKLYLDPELAKTIDTASRSIPVVDDQFAHPRTALCGRQSAGGNRRIGVQPTGGRSSACHRQPEGFHLTAGGRRHRQRRQRHDGSRLGRVAVWPGAVCV